MGIGASASPGRCAETAAQSDSRWFYIAGTGAQHYVPRPLKMSSNTSLPQRCATNAARYHTHSTAPGFPGLSGSQRRLSSTVVACLIAAALPLACSAGDEPATPDNGGPSTPSTRPGATDGGDAGVDRPNAPRTPDEPDDPTASGGDAPRDPRTPSDMMSDPEGPDPELGGDLTSPLLPARIRRLTNAEYDASVQALLQTQKAPSVEFSFPPDARQGPKNAPAGAAFTVNDAQRVDPVLAVRLDSAAQALVAEARASGKLSELSPCGDPAGAGEQCAAEFLRSFGAKAYRRPVTDVEVENLVSAPTSPYHVGADGYTYEDGIDVLARVVLQSPGFLYLTELGEGAGSDPVQLSNNELATQLSYLLTGGPPDATLLEQAAAGNLTTTEGREAEARRLLDTPAGHARFVRVVREWLGIDDVARREKSASIYPEFADASEAMEEESRAFIEEVLFRSTGTLTELLTADWTIVSESLANLYGVPWGGEGQRTSLADAGRRGILNQGAFLSVFASNNGSHPVYRGVALMRRVACLETPDPGALGIVVSFPPPDPNRTTRERFQVHTEAPGCEGCHTLIDGLGFTMENFDGIGKVRATENERPIDTNVTLDVGSELDGSYGDSTELLAALAKSDGVKSCLARQLFRSSAARSNETVAVAEDAFVNFWNELAAERQDNLIEVLIAYVASPSFIQRRPL